jgi:subtilisin family serine protease
MTALAASRDRRPLRRRVRLTLELLEARTAPSANPLGDVFLQATPNDPGFGQLYGMQRIQAPAAWNVTTGSSRVVVADVDSGADYTHPDLYKNIWINQGELPQAVFDVIAARPVTFHELNEANADGALAFPQWDSDGNNRIDGKDALALWSNGDDADANGYTDDLIGWNFVAGNNNPMDDNGHGTHTAGTIGAMGNNGVGVAGVSWQVQIMPLKFLAGDGSGSLGGAAAALRYAVDNHAVASNHSWIYYRGAAGDVVHQAVAYAQTHNHLVIAAAGNDGFNNDTAFFRAYPASVSNSNIIAVAASDQRDAKPRWSNYGQSSVDLAAPGVNILSTVPGGGYELGSGTSMATPHVTGAVALVLAARPDLTGAAALVKSLILDNVDPVKSLNKTVTGGRLNVAKAVNAALAVAAPEAAAAPLAGAGAAGASRRGGNEGGRASAAAVLLRTFQEALLTLSSVDGVAPASPLRNADATPPQSSRSSQRSLPRTSRTESSAPKLVDGYLLFDLAETDELTDEQAAAGEGQGETAGTEQEEATAEPAAAE